MKFPWFKIRVRDDKTGILRVVKEVPAIPFKITYRDKSRDLMGLVDSGADFITMTSDIAKSLGIDLKQGEEIDSRGCGGGFKGSKFEDIKIEIAGYTFEVPVVFSIPVKKNQWHPPLLGIRGFFEYFKVIVNAKKKTTELKPFDK